MPNTNDIIPQFLNITGLVLDVVGERVWPFVIHPSAPCSFVILTMS